MKIKYKAEFIDDHTINVSFDRKMLDKVENLYFYVIQNNRIVEVTTSVKQTLVDGNVYFEVILSNPVDLNSPYDILVCKNAMVRIDSPKQNR